jgi:hypothetical protein
MSLCKNSRGNFASAADKSANPSFRRQSSAKASEEAADAPKAPPQVHVCLTLSSLTLSRMDFSLKQGEMISINIGGGPSSSSKPKASPGLQKSGAIPLLPPPPSSSGSGVRRKT